jgi:hypothetical protein
MLAINLNEFMTEDANLAQLRAKSPQDLFDFATTHSLVVRVKDITGVYYGASYLSMICLLQKEYLTWDQVEACMSDSEFDSLFSDEFEISDDTVRLFARLLHKLHHELIFNIQSAENRILALVQRGAITEEEMDYFMKRGAGEVSPNDLYLQSIDLHNYLREENKRWARHDWQYLVPVTPDIWFGEPEPGDLVFDSSVLAYIGRVPEEVLALTDEARNRVDNEIPEALDD